LNRGYVNPALRTEANLFVAYFKTQRTGQMPHSPKNCLPGNGWTQTLSDTINVNVPGRDTPIEVNRYLVSKGQNKSVVVYWYQSRDRVVASEYRARFFTAADAIRYNRTDTALVRVVVPVVNDDDKRATDTALNFVKDFFGPLRQHFPA
jgi:EpsI family protein